MSELGSNKLRNASRCSALCRQESLEICHSVWCSKKFCDAGPYFCKELTQYLVAVIIITPLNLHA